MDASQTYTYWTLLTSCVAIVSSQSWFVESAGHCTCRQACSGVFMRVSTYIQTWPLRVVHIMTHPISPC